MRTFVGNALTPARPRRIWRRVLVAFLILLVAVVTTLWSGDTAMQDAFIEIGKRLGPFDLTMIEVGAYDAAWADVHLGPEQAVRAHQLVRGDVMLPVHWGLFDLALHGWTEPIERVLVAAGAAGIRVAAPRPGDRVEPALLGPVSRWWPDVPWKTAAESPVISSGTAHLMAGPVP